MGLAVAKALSGKKTYILAALMLASLGMLLFFGKLTPELAFEVLVFAAPCFAATYRDAMQTHHNQVMDVLLDAVDAGVAMRAHNYAALEGIAAKAAGDVEKVTVTTASVASVQLAAGQAPVKPEGA